MTIKTTVAEHPAHKDGFTVDVEDYQDGKQPRIIVSSEFYLDADRGSNFNRAMIFARIETQKAITANNDCASKDTE